MNLRGIWLDSLDVPIMKAFSLLSTTVAWVLLFFPLLFELPIPHLENFSHDWLSFFSVTSSKRDLNALQHCRRLAFGILLKTGPCFIKLIGPEFVVTLCTCEDTWVEFWQEFCVKLSSSGNNSNSHVVLTLCLMNRGYIVSTHFPARP